MSSPDPAARLQAAYPRYSVSICRYALANPRCLEGDVKVKFWCLTSDAQVRALLADREPSPGACGPSPGQTFTPPARTCRGTTLACQRESQATRLSCADT